MTWYRAIHNITFDYRIVRIIILSIIGIGESLAEQIELLTANKGAAMNAATENFERAKDFEKNNRNEQQDRFIFKIMKPKIDKGGIEE